MATLLRSQSKSVGLKWYNSVQDTTVSFLAGSKKTKMQLEVVYTAWHARTCTHAHTYNISAIR